MALFLQKEDRFGATGVSYWVVSEIKMCKNEQSLVVLLGYVNEEQRRLGKDPLEKKTYHLILQEGNAFEMAYEAIKALPEFANSQDV
jgi:hypothetical protein